MKRGRKPLPTALKIVRGNPGKRPLNEAEPKPLAEAPQCPEHLDQEAQREWERIVPELLQIGVLTRVDRTALAAYCACWSRWVNAEQQIQRYGPVLLTKNKSYLMQSPYVSIANQALKQIRAFLAEFGLTPSSRSGLKITPPKQGIVPRIRA